MSAPGDLRAGANSKVDWVTPDAFWQRVDAKYHFTLDAAADAENTKCKKFFSKENNALRYGHVLVDEVVWCNPPYGGGLLGMPQWSAAFARWAKQGNVVVALLPVATGSRWFKSVWNNAAEIWLLMPRIQFVGSMSSNTVDSMLVVYDESKRGQDGPVFRLWDWKQLDGHGTMPE